MAFRFLVLPTITLSQAYTENTNLNAYSCSNAVTSLNTAKNLKNSICIEFNKHLKFTHAYFICLPASLPANLLSDPVALYVAMAPGFLHNKAHWIYETIVLKNVYPLHHDVSI